MTRKMNRWTWLIPVAALATTGALWTEGRANARHAMPVGVDYYFPSTGIVDGEMLRVMVANLEDVPPGPCRITVMDAQGNNVADSGELQIPASGIGSFNMSWGRLAIAPERANGRKQFRVR